MSVVSVSQPVHILIISIGITSMIIRIIQSTPFLKCGVVFERLSFSRVHPWLQFVGHRLTCLPQRWTWLLVNPPDSGSESMGDIYYYSIYSMIMYGPRLVSVRSELRFKRGWDRKEQAAKIEKR